MKKTSHLIVMLLATRCLGAVELVPRNIYTPSAKAQDAAAADVLTDKYKIYTNGPGGLPGQRYGCLPLGIDDPGDQKFVREKLPRNHIVCSDVIDLTELSPEWATTYNREVLRLLKGRQSK